MAVVRQSGLGGIRVSDPEIHEALTKITELLRLWNGEGRDPLDRIITLRDLVEGTDAAEALRRAGFDVPSGSTLGELLTPGGSGVDRTPPPKPTNLQAAGAFNSVILTWEFPESYTGAMFEIHRSAADDLGQADLVGLAKGRVYTDQVQPGSQYYYWVRAVSAAGVDGPFNDVAGTLGETAEDPKTVVAIITQKKWAANTRVKQFYVVSPPTLVKDPSGAELVFQAQNSGMTGAVEPNWTAAAAAGATLADNEVVWEAITADNAPLILGDIGGVPVAYLANAVIKDGSIGNAKIADLAVDSAKVATAAIGTAHIQDGAITNLKIGGYIQSDVFEPRADGTGKGWRIHKDGTAEFYNVYASGRVEGSTIKGGVVDGAQIIASTVTRVTEAGDPYYTDYDPIISTLTTGVPDGWTGYSGRYDKDRARQHGYLYSPYMDLLPYNGGDTASYYRFMKAAPRIRIEVVIQGGTCPGGWNTENIARNTEYKGYIELVVGTSVVARTDWYWNKSGSYASGDGTVLAQYTDRLHAVIDKPIAFSAGQSMRAKVYLETWRGSDFPCMTGYLSLIGYSQE